MSPEKPQPVFVRCYIENPGGDATRSAPRPVAYQRRPPRARNRPSYVAARLTGLGAAETVVPQLVARLFSGLVASVPSSLRGRALVASARFAASRASAEQRNPQ